jgi:guanylate kinase
MKMRLDKAENEMKSAPKFQHIVHNNILSEAGAEIEELVTQFIKS